MYFLIKMQNTQALNVRLISRYICTDNAKYSISRQSKFLNKLINRSQSKRDPVESIIDSISCKSAKNQLSVHTLRRMSVLNKVFMEHITDMMSTGEIEPEILNRNIEISHVKVTPDFKLINVYWIDNSLEKSNTEELLKSCAFQLRHELSQLRVIGNVPPVQFVKCRGTTKMREVEQKLNTLNFDAEHTSTPYPNDLHYTVTATTSVNVTKVEDDENSSADIFSVSVPMMRHNVFGLDHYRIMSKIKTSINKSRKDLKKKAVTTDSSQTSKSNVQHIPNFLTEKEQQEQFKEFIAKTQRQLRYKMKNRRSKRNDFIFDFEEQNDDSYDHTLNDYDDFDEEHNDDDFDEHIDEEFDKER